ncbi:MAG: TRAP transporter small permease [Candidatus Marinimicrobia bacterium]|nr:TRAP transporter small permease [Candidatus Neomarinimicrobiota bacterium]MBT4035296.1 TRAP transporter small permease [Candidatus Neomarinimicrobiota bacterium]MBT4359733.1 TRAP transporter small permease [Candidatus Neomarinimicrobiota bacterium]MBT4713745.1 TRAP transporter small permease [Candidatus Neomarinimicrobiota bacterium]MBT4946905.1 TRAP transporter small permease [Candidatus Neomarinimicrobiota bacterium]
MMKAIVSLLDKLLSKFLIGLMGAIVLVVTWQVATRFLMSSPSSYTEELARFLLIWIGVLGGSYALRTRAHLGIDILSTKLQGRQKDMLMIGIYLAIILFSVLILVIGGIKLVALTFTLNQISASLGLKMGYIYLVLPLSGSIMVIYSIDVILDALKGRTSFEEVN